MNVGDIVLLRFPRTDLRRGKLRPALIVAVAPGRHADLLLAMISSNIYQTIPNFDEVIAITDDDYAATRLKTQSVIRLARLASVEPLAVNARLGRISDKRLQLIRRRLANWLNTNTRYRV